MSALTAIRALLPDISSRASDVDRTGAVDPEAVPRLQQAGLFAMLQPNEFSGTESEPSDYLTAIREISAACTSTGWLAGQLSVNQWHIALFDEHAQRDVWGRDSGALVCASYAPTGRLEKVADGYLLSGRWALCTGAQHASWLMAGAVLIGADGGAEDFLSVLVPRTDFRVESAWNGLGLRGIDSGDAIVAGVVVPTYRTFGWVSRDQRATLAPLFRLPQPTLYTHAGTAPLLGAALTALDACGTPADDLDPLAMARADLELSDLQIRRNLADLMASARAGTEPDNDLILRSRRDQVAAAERAVRAVHTAQRYRDDTLTDRLWRDVQTARIHVANNTEQVLTVVGRFAFGLPVDDIMW